MEGENNNCDTAPSLKRASRRESGSRKSLSLFSAPLDIGEEKGVATEEGSRKKREAGGSRRRRFTHPVPSSTLVLFPPGSAGLRRYNE